MRTANKFRVLGDSRDDELAALEADIAQRGVLVPIEVDDKGNVLDGKARLQIAKKLGVDCPRKVRRLGSDDAKTEHALKIQLLKRDVGPVSWARGFQKLLEIRGVDRIRGPKPQLEGGIYATVAEIAAEVAVAERTAYNRLQLFEDVKDHPEIAAAVDRGEISASQARAQVGVSGIRKPEVGNGVSHPARYSAELIEVFGEVLAGYKWVLDPFAGTGLIHELQDYGHATAGIELEPEWAELHPDTQVGDARELPFDDEHFDAICTSPTYGNRMADSHNARDASTRRSYTHDLGRKLSAGNSGRLQWGPKYREFHEEAWAEVERVLRPRGLFVLNTKDHIRSGKRQFVSGWHVSVLCGLGLELLHHVEVDARSMKAGANGELRCPEYVYVLEKVA